MLKIWKLHKKVEDFISIHKLYASLHVLLLSIVLAVVLMQAGSLFLLDYIPDHLAAVRKAYEHELLWKYEVKGLSDHLADKDSVAFWKLDKSDVDLTGAEFSWFKKQSDPELREAYKKLRQAHSAFASAHASGQSNQYLAQLGQQVISAYENFIRAAEKDIEIKQSVISLLQLACLFLVFCIAASLMLSSRRVLIDRVGHLISIMPKNLVSGVRKQTDDEFELIERLVAEVSAQLEGIKVETDWINKTSTERIRRMTLSQDFLFKLVKLVESSGLSELTIKKALYSLERTLNVSNVSLVFSDNGSVISAQRALFSNHWPLCFHEGLFDEKASTMSVSHSSVEIDGKVVRCLTVPLPGAMGCLGLLMVETEDTHFFENTEIQLVEVTAQLLALSMGFQAREQEGRRAALLEERAVIARELHDSLAQSLSYMKIQIARLKTQFGDDVQQTGVVEIVNDLRVGLDNAYRELRELLSTFRVQMDVRGLDYALREAIDEFSQRSSLSITLDNRLVDCRLTVNEEFHLLQVVREGLSNIVRHSGASAVVITLVLQPTGEVMVTIDDDGLGCAFKEQEPHHYGLAIMNERAGFLGGEIKILPRRRGGTRVRLLFRPKSK
jgi:two-component system nitrate/nitrite sensor histidine kinase NarX